MSERVDKNLEPMITTVLTTFRRPQLLKRAIESVLSQSYQNFRLIICDNASGDETKAVVQSFKDPRIQYFCHEANIGMMPNYAFGLSKVTTPFFSFLSDDDCLYPCFFETAIRGLLKHSDAAFSACGVEAFDIKGNFVTNPISFWKRESYYKKADGLSEIMSEKCKWPIPTCVLFRTEYLKDVYPDFSEDIQLLWDPNYLIQLAACFPIYIDKKLCGSYLVHDSGFSAQVILRMVNKPQDNLEAYMKVFRQIFMRIENHKMIEASEKAFIVKSLNLMIQKEFSYYICHYLETKKYGDSFYFMKFFYRTFGVRRELLNSFKAFFKGKARKAYHFLKS